MNTIIKIVPFVLASLGTIDTATAGPRSKLAAAGPSTNAADIPPLAKLLDEAGWTPTPELSGVYKAGSIFQVTGSSHALMIRDCFQAEATEDTYTAMEVVTQLQAGVRVRAGLFGARSEGEIIKKLSFSTPVHHTLERLSMEPTPDCQAKLGKTTADDRQDMYAVQEVLTAAIAEQTCGRVTAEGRFVGLGAAEAELSQACAQESLEPVAVAYRIVPLAEFNLSPARTVTTVVNDADCPWGSIRSVSSTIKTLSINGKTFDVRGLEQRTMLIDTMNRCGHEDAALAFDSWRLNRRVTNISAATVVGFYPFCVGIVSALKAGKRRELMERLLSDPDSVSEEEKAKLR
jgi:hypothetical protein